MKRNNIFLICICVLLSSCVRTSDIKKEQPDTTLPNKAYSQLEPTGSPLYDSAIKSCLTGLHRVVVLNNGDDALLARLHLIRQAQRSIYIQTFIFSDDESCVLIAEELLKAAGRGVKIKLIIDAFGMPKDLGVIAYLVASPNVEVKCFNPVSSVILPSKLALIEKAGLDFEGLNRRMHNKIFVVDNIAAITGGRNYQNDYFDRGVHRNFKDRDVLVSGPVVSEMAESFSLYWNFELAVSTNDMNNVANVLKKWQADENASSRLKRDDSLFERLNEHESDRSYIKERFFDRAYDIGEISFFSDCPSKLEKIGNKNISETALELRNFLSDCESSVVMQTPYLVAGKKTTRFFKHLARDNPSVDFIVSSNSLAAADHVYAYAFSYKNKKKYLKAFRWRIFEFKPLPKDMDLMITPINGDSRADDYITCIHAKTYVVDKKKVWVGSFNLSPRSVNLNTEVGIVVEDARVASDIAEDIQRDISDGNSWTIARRPAVPVVSRFSRPVGNMMRAIPVIDVWPFVYSGCFELKEGKKPVPYYDSLFYENYKYVGPFPGVRIGSEKEIQARLIKSFLGPVEPLI